MSTSDKLTCSFLPDLSSEIDALGPRTTIGDIQAVRARHACPKPARWRVQARGLTLAACDDHLPVLMDSAIEFYSVWRVEADANGVPEAPIDLVDTHPTRQPESVDGEGEG